MTAAEEAAARHSELKTLMEQTLGSVTELGTKFALHEQSDEHVHAAHDGRLTSLEETAEATGQHKVVTLQKTIDVWKGRLWSLIAAFLFAGISGLVVHYFHTH